MWQLSHEMDDNEFKELYEIDHCRLLATFNLSNEKKSIFRFRLAKYTASIKK